MYEEAVTSVRTTGGGIVEFPMTIGLHPESTLSPYLFTLIMDDSREGTLVYVVCR